MEKIDLPLSKLTLTQKLDLMEAIWDDLTKHEEELESPEWHERVLSDREEAVVTGRATVSDWEDAKATVRRKVTCD